MVGGTRSVTRPATVSTAPVRDPLRVAAIVLAALVAAGWAIALFRFRRRQPRPPREDAVYGQQRELIDARAG